MDIQKVVNKVLRYFFEQGKSYGVRSYCDCGDELIFECTGLDEYRAYDPTVFHLITDLEGNVKHVLSGTGYIYMLNKNIKPQDFTLLKLE